MNLELTYSAAQSHIFFDSEFLGRFRIFPKGRRLGATRGAAGAFTEWMLEGKACLWGNTINANIDRYVERYFLPLLNANDVPHHWRQQKKTLEVGSGYTDFRSADNPRTWEGFGYHKIFLNEAGIILDDRYLYQNAVLPMMMDFPDSTLIAAGTPKLSQMRGELFRELWDKAEAGDEGYYGKRFSSYDNPWLTPADIATLESEISPAERPQEIGGFFISPEGLGSFFQRGWFPKLEASTPLYRTVRAWDFAATEPSEANPNPDFTVGVKLGITGTGTVCIVDVVFDRKGPGGVDALLTRTAVQDGHATEHVIPVDPGAAGKTAAQHFADHPLKGYTVHEYSQTKQQGSKATRATPASVAASEGRIGYVVDDHWNSWFFSQLEPFPNPRVHDDAVDALSAGFNHLVLGDMRPNAQNNLTAASAVAAALRRRNP